MKSLLFITIAGVLGLIGIVIFNQSLKQTVSPQSEIARVSTNQVSAINSIQPTSEPTSAPVETKPLPPISLTDLDGNQLTAADFADKPTLLKVGTQYCHVCMEEVPEIQAAFNKIGADTNIGFVLINATKQQAINYQKKYDITYPIYLDNQKQTARLFQVTATPTHIFLDSQAQPIARRVGFMNTEQITKVLTELL